MSTVTVYRFKQWSQQTGDYVVSRRMATRSAIERIPSLVLIEGTEAEIDGANLDSNGMTVRDFYPVEEFDVDLRERTVLHRPSGITFSFYEYHNEDDWEKSDSVIYRERPDWQGDRMLLAAAAKRAALAKDMRAQKPLSR